MTRRHDTSHGEGAMTRRHDTSHGEGARARRMISILIGVLTGVLTGVPAKTADPAHGVPFSRHQEKRRFDSHTISAAVNSAAPAIGYITRRELVVPYISSTPRNTQPTLSAAIP